MLTLTIKDVRKALDEALSKFFSFTDYNVCPTEVKNDDQEFRISFKIYNDKFWMDINAGVDFIHIAASDSNPIKTIHIYLPMFKYNKENFDFGWRTDLECFFDTFKANLFEKLEQNRKAAVERCNARNDTPIKIGPLREDLIMKNLEMEEAAAYEEYMAEAKKADEAKKEKSVIAQCIDAMYKEEPDILDKLYEEDAKIGESKIGECKIGESKTSIFNSLKDDEDEDEDEYI